MSLLGDDEHYLLLTFLLTALMQLSFFAIAYSRQIDKLTDLAGSTNFVILATVTLYLGESYTLEKAVASLMVIVWGLRLGSYLFYRIFVWGEDRRFDNIRHDFRKFLGFWTLQIMWVWLVSLPVIYFNSISAGFSWSDLSTIGVSLFVLGFAIESLADYQKFRHKQSGSGWCRTGLWGLSRHPNYFGEILLWSGIFAFCNSGGVPVWTVVGLVFLTVLLLFVSGIPFLETSASQKYSGRPGYEVYRRDTSIFFPLPPSLYKKIPDGLKATLLLDFKR
jgi:steroid 5-alpha reductase family enzyme